MVGRITLTLSSLVALAQSKAIVHNLCEHDIYVWSVPGSAIVNKALKPGDAYYEPFHQGTQANPGVAIKVSSQSGGIDNGKDELDFSYTVDSVDKSKVWINLDSVRSNAFGDNLAFDTCHGPYKTPFVPTRRCSISDNIELVLCGTERSSPPQDPSSIDDLTHCSTSWFEKRNGTETEHRRFNPCHGRVGSPKRIALPGHKEGVKKQEKDQAPEAKPTENTQPKPVERKPDPEKMHHIPNAHRPKHSDPSANQSNKHHFDCFADGQGMHCDWNDKALAKKIARKDDSCWCHLVAAFSPGVQCNEQIVKDNYELIWNNACIRLSAMGADCDSVRAQMESICPNPNTKRSELPSRDAPAPKEKVEPAELRQGKKYELACFMLGQMFEDVYNTKRCELIAKKLVNDHGKRDVNIEDRVKENLPGLQDNYVEKEMKFYWPEIDWDE
jgi:hypothetical protein